MRRSSQGKQPPPQSRIDKIVGLLNNGQPETARELSRQLLDQFPDDAFLNNLSGVACTHIGELEEAATYYNHAVTLRPDYEEAWSNLGTIWLRQKQPGKAKLAFEKAVRLGPASAKNYNNLGAALRDARDLVFAKQSFSKALELNGKYAEALNNLGNIHQEMDELDEARELFHRAIAEKPNLIEAHYNLGIIDGTQNNLAAAKSRFARVLQLNPEHVNALNQLAILTARSGHLHEAADLHRRALELDPNCLEAHSALGAVQGELGDIEGAKQQINKVLTLNPKLAAAHRNLALLTHYQPQDEHLGQMLNLLNESTEEEDKIHFHFALAKAFSDCGDHEKAFFHCAQGNQLNHAVINYNPRVWTDKVDRIIDALHERHFSQVCDVTISKTTPLFVLGLPRSGKTSLERLLAAHPDIAGAGELTVVESALANLIEISRYPESAIALSIEQLTAARVEILAGLDKVPQASQYTVISLPGNYLYLGFIHMMFPESPIVHCTRGPVANCLALYFKYFSNGGHIYAYNLKDIGAYYCDYKRLMKHWESVIPRRTIEVHFDHVVQGKVASIMELFQAINLEWDGHMTPYFEQPSTSALPVEITASQAYMDSLENWKTYEKHLGSLLDSLPGQL